MPDDVIKYLAYYRINFKDKYTATPLLTIIRITCRLQKRHFNPPFLQVFPLQKVIETKQRMHFRYKDIIDYPMIVNPVDSAGSRGYSKEQIEKAALFVT